MTEVRHQDRAFARLGAKLVKLWDNSRRGYREVIGYTLFRLPTDRTTMDDCIHVELLFFSKKGMRAKLY